MNKQEDGQATDHEFIQVELDSSGEENQALLAKKKKDAEALPRCYALRRCCGCIVSRERRTVSLDGRTRPRTFPTNRENN